MCCRKNAKISTDPESSSARPQTASRSAATTTTRAAETTPAQSEQRPVSAAQKPASRPASGRPGSSAPRSSTPVLTSHTPHVSNKITLPPLTLPTTSADKPTEQVAMSQAAPPDETGSRPASANNRPASGGNRPASGSKQTQEHSRTATPVINEGQTPLDAGKHNYSQVSIGHVNNNPTMQFFTGISRNIQSMTWCVQDFQDNAL